jgi:ATP-dependent Clp protease ATP-binding subunit ClpX
MKHDKCIICNQELRDGEWNCMISPGKIICSACAHRVQKVTNTVDGTEENRAESLRFRDGASHQAMATEVARAAVSRITPHRIKEMLDEFVVGQEDAKIVLANASYNHLKRTALKDPSIQKSNILLIGPTGCGKTHLVRTLGKILNVPVAITPATNLTEAGYVGKAAHGIIIIDEIDKLISNGHNGSRKEVGGTGVQQALLPIIEGASVTVNMKKEAGMMGGLGSIVTVDTTNILFICGGAFPDMDNIIRARLNKNSRMGFSPSPARREEIDEKNLLRMIEPEEDLKEFGLIPEFIGRIPVCVSLEALDADTLRRILTEPKDSIVRQYRKLFAYDEVDLVFENSALDAIAEKATERHCGARSLRSILESVLRDAMYDAPSDDNISQICITREYVMGESQKPRIVYRDHFEEPVHDARSPSRQTAWWHLGK